MARVKASGVFVVTPYQAEDGEDVKGIAFASAAQATEFSSKVLKFATKLAAKIKGLERDEAKAFSEALGMDIIIQPTDKDGNPSGEPALFDTVGV